ncbi:MAG: hypothetical protein AB8B82_10565 [Roseovarius sp.]
MAACSDPIEDIPRLSDQDLPETSASVEVAAAPVPDNTSLLARLLGDTQPPSVMSEPEASETPSSAVAEADATGLEDTPPTGADPVEVDIAASSPAPEQAGLLALFTHAVTPKQKPAPVSDTSQAVEVALADPDQITETTQASLPATPQAEADPDPAPGTKHKSIFGITKPKPQPAVSEIPPGTVLPYGKLARICGVPKRDMGKQVAQFPENRPKHRIYDTAPGSTAPHTFYVTGFDDGCARQFTAALAMFGSVEMHELLRYGLPAEVQPYSDTDKAYETLKSRVCKVPRKKPCGTKISRLGNGTVFISIYERFGSNARWKSLLLHDGEVLAQDIKGG